MAQGSRAPLHPREVETRIGRALLAADARDGVVIRGLIDGELTVTYGNSPEE